MSEKDEGRMFLLAVYRSRPNTFQAPGGYWFLRITNTLTSSVTEVSLTPGKAEQLETMGVPRIEDGGGL